jgi:hypothetical protein
MMFHDLWISLWRNIIKIHILRNSSITHICITKSKTTSNSINFIKEQINFFRSLISMKKSISLISYYYNIEAKQARETLKGFVLSSNYFKIKFIYYDNYNIIFHVIISNSYEDYKIYYDLVKFFYFIKQ